MRRLYSTFAGGWPGAGLLMMRLVVGCALVVRASWRLGSVSSVNVAVTAALLLGAGCLLILGLRTAIAGSAVAITELWKMLTLPGDRSLWLLLGTMGVALAMLGPGLWSLDARLYGWKRVEVPRGKK